MPNDLQRNGPTDGGRFRLYADQNGELQAAPLTMSNEQAAPFMFKAMQPLRATLRMYAPDNKSFGTMWFDENGCFQFEGDASASAQVLFNEMKRLSGK